MSRTTLTLSALFGVLAAHVSAQTPGSEPLQGISANSPAGLLVSDLGGPPGATELLVRETGAALGAPQPWTPAQFGQPDASTPDFSLGALRRAWFDADFKAISTGNDVVPRVLADGRMAVNNLWFNIAVTVDAATVGSNGSLLNQLRSETPNAAVGSVFSYYEEASQNLAPGYAGAVLVEQTAAQVGIPGAPALLGLDWGLGVIATTPGVAGGDPMFSIRDRFYFTVTGEWAALNFWRQAENPRTQSLENVNSATVYRMDWELGPNSQYQWSDPVVEVSNTELALGPEVQIDALGHFRRGARETTVFSTNSRGPQPTPRLDEVLVFSRESGVIYAQRQPLRTQRGTLLSAELGLLPPPTGASGDPDNVEGICMRDPLEFEVSWFAGTPQYTTPITNTSLGIAMHRTMVDPEVGPPSQHQLHIQTDGLNAVSSTGGVVFFTFMTSGPANPANPANMPYTLVGDPYIVSVPVAANQDSAWCRLPGVTMGTYSNLYLHAGALYLSSPGGGSPTFVQQSAWSVILY